MSVGTAFFAACGGSSSSASGGSQFTIIEASNGFGRLLPYQVAVRDAVGNPTARVIEITSYADLVNNVTAANPVKAPTEWPTAALLPNSAPGNHFFYVRFNQAIDVGSVLNALVSTSAVSTLTGAIQVVEVDPGANTVTDVPGRGFVGGKSYGPTLDPVNIGDFLLETWVTRNGNGDLEAADIDGFTPGLGFPGTEPGTGFAGDDVLVDDHTFVFVVDDDGDLASHEIFAAGKQIQIRINEDVTSVSGRHIEEIGLASATVGPDTIPPEVFGSTPNDGSGAVILPRDDEIDVDPETNIEIQFTEPIQVLTLAELDDGTPPGLSSAIQIEFGPSAGRVQVPYFLRPFSIYDLSRLELVPAYNFPGSGPQVGDLNCATFGTVSVLVNSLQFRDLNEVPSTHQFRTEFTTREGTGVVNAPVVPDAIYLGRGGATPGLSVIDMYGFGGGTGNPTYDQLLPIQEGNSNFPNNPNVSVLGASLTPPLTPGQCTIDGGSAGVFTLTKDSSLNDLLARAPILESVGDMAVGHALDNSFNNAAPFGCQAGGGNICATTGLKNIILSAGGANALAPSTTSTLATKIVSGGENLVGFSPSPNPPPLVFPPLCLAPLIGAQEPTQRGQPNLLVPGANSRGNPALNRPPTNLLVNSQNAFNEGPSVPQPLVTNCTLYSMRQQIGHFLYVVDRVSGEVVVLNSNRFSVIDRVRTPDPTSLAMSPNLDLLAVTNESADQVSFIDTDPSSSTFHQVVRTVPVGAGPTGIAWESGNEDLFVCNQGDGSVTVLSAFSLRPRKIVRNQITRPIDVALTPRQLGFGFRRGVYFGYILNQNGSCAVFESGPDGNNGWGFDDTIATLPFQFFQPKAIQPDVQRLNSAVWILHENRLDANGLPTGETGGALSSVGIASGVQGIIPFTSGAIINPQIRNLEFGVLSSVGEGPNALSGVPVDIAFDNMQNLSALNNYSSQFSAGQPLSFNGKSLVRFNGGQFASACFPQFMFLAIPNPGVVDVLELDTGTVQRVDTNVFRPGLQSIPAPNVNVLADFFRQ
ncbi:MAG: hypothetical protein EXS08_08020 [Planctomycetes bacterium]|nr:hypothetical protein [Planctomycetota bacterium]